MNFVAIIGVINVCNKNKNNETSEIFVKLEKPFIKSPNEDWFEQIKILVDSTIFYHELRLIKKGKVVGIKGRLTALEDGNTTVTAERVQVF